MPDSPRPVPEDALLLCVDMQPAFIAAVIDGPEITRRCEFALAAAVGLGLPVAFTEQVPEKLGPTVPGLLALARGAAVFAKNTFSALADEKVHDELLRQRDVRHIILCGVETPVCIYQTAIAAIAEGVEVTVLSDAVGARRAEDAQVCLQALARLGGHVLPAETLFYSLLHDVAHPFFRDYTRLVKRYGKMTHV